MQQNSGEAGRHVANLKELLESWEQLSRAQTNAEEVSQKLLSFSQVDN